MNVKRQSEFKNDNDTARRPTECRQQIFHFSGLPIERGVVLQTDVDEAIDWLRDFFPPFITWTPKQHIAAERVRVKRRSVPLIRSTHSERVQGFLGRDLTQWTYESRRYWSYPSGYTIAEEKKGFSVWINPDDKGEIKELARFVRELAIGSLLRQGAIKLKANALIDSFGKSVLVLGEKGAGKTSLMMRELLNGGEFIANSRVLLISENGLPSAHGLPISVRIGEDLIKSLPRFREWYRFYFSVSKLQLKQFDWKVGFCKVELTPSEVAEISLAPIRTHTPVDEICFITGKGSTSVVLTAKKKRSC